MDEASGEDGRMRRFKSGSGDINLEAAGGSPCDLCQPLPGRCRRVVSDSLTAAVSAPELVFHHTLTDRRATVYHLGSLPPALPDRFVKKRSSVSGKAPTR